MAIDVKRFNQLQQAAAEAQRARDQAQGALDALMAQLQREYGVGTLPEAEARLAELQEERDDADAAYNRELAKFEKQYAQQVDELPDED